MRWYKIVTASQTWDASGDPNALNVQLDIPVAAESAPKAGAYARIWGIPLSLLLSANQFTNQDIEVYGGMQQGLPLANPAQQGLLCRGKIFPALGNWVNTDMTLDFYIPVPVGGPTVPQAANVIHYVPANTPLSGPLQQALQTAFPGFTINMNISSQLVRAYDQQGFYQTLGQYATFLFNLSKDIIKTQGYLGVHVVVRGQTINVFDGTTTTSSAGTINFQDLIGQPIWTGTNTVQFKTVMRGDIKVGDTVTLPKSLATLTNQGGAALPGSGNSNIIQGQFLVQQIRHTGNFRQPDWPSWASTFDAIKPSSTGSTGNTPSGNSGSTPTGQGGIGHQ